MTVIWGRMAMRTTAYTNRWDRILRVPVHFSATMGFKAVME